MIQPIESKTIIMPYVKLIAKLLYDMKMKTANHKVTALLIHRSESERPKGSEYEVKVPA